MIQMMKFAKLFRSIKQLLQTSIFSCWSERLMTIFFLCIMEVAFSHFFFHQKPVFLYIFCLYFPKLPTYQAILHSRMRCPLPSLRDQTTFSRFQLMGESRSCCMPRTCKLFSQYWSKEERLPYSQQT